MELRGAACARGLAPLDEGRQDLSQHVILVHPDALVRIELHRQPLSASSRAAAGDPDAARASTMPLGDAVVAVPSVEDQLVHLVAHGMLQHAFLRNGRCVLRELVELKLLLARAEARDVELARERFAALGQALAWDVSLELCARCLGGVPGASLADGQPACHPHADAAARGLGHAAARAAGLVRCAAVRAAVGRTVQLGPAPSRRPPEGVPPQDHVVKGGQIPPPATPSRPRGHWRRPRGRPYRPVVR